MKKWLAILFFPTLLQAGPDSLMAVLNTNAPDSVKIKALSNLIGFYEYKNPDTTEIFAKKLYLMASHNSSNPGLGDYFNYTGRKHYFVQQFDSALHYFKKALGYYEKGKSARGVSSARNNIATVYMEKGDVKNCLRTYRELLYYNIKNNAEGQLATVYANIGTVYAQQTIYDSAIYYNNLSLKLHEKLNQRDQMAIDLLNLAVVNSNMKQHQKALEYLNKIFEEKIHVKQSFYSRIWTLKAGIFKSMKELDSAEYYIKRSIQNAELTGDRLSQMGALSTYAQFLAELGKYEESEKICRRELELSLQVGAKQQTRIAYHDLAQILALREKYSESIECFTKSIEIEKELRSDGNIFESLKGISHCYMKKGDPVMALLFLDSALSYSVRRNEAQKFRDMMEIETRFETEKKDLQIQKANSEIELQAETNRQKSRVIWVGTVALALTLFFAIMALFNFRKARNFAAKVQEQNRSLEIKNTEIQQQKSLVEEKQQEIIASINYAQRIQSAVLTGDEVWKRVAKEHFILFQPKDIVSGDFYWAHVLQNGRAVFAVADCTGHGVPGGFMSMLGNSFLNEIVVENKIFSAPKILNKLREKIISALEQKGQTGQQDGMDIALCVWNKIDNSLEFAGANNNMYLFRNGRLELAAGDKMPIGTHVNDKNDFSSKTFQLEKGNTIYLTTDGFVDQFGGPKGKKYKYSQFEAVLAALQDVPMEHQAEILRKDFAGWKGNLEQTDDVCVIGIKC